MEGRPRRAAGWAEAAWGGLGLASLKFPSSAIIKTLFVMKKH